MLDHHPPAATTRPPTNTPRSYAPHVAGRGVPVVEVNLEPTGNSRVCSLTFKGRAGLMLPRLLQVGRGGAGVVVRAAAYEFIHAPDSIQLHI